MLDDATVLARLDSDLYGALTHVGQLAQRAVAADITASRILGGPPVSQASYLCGARLGIDGRDEESLGGWIDDDASLFGFVARQPVRDAVFRPRDLVDELEYARLRLFRRVEALTRVRDAVCLTFRLNDQAWCVMAMLRCGESPAFGGSEVAALERLRPAFRRVVARSLERETSPRGLSARVHGNQIVHQPASSAELLAKLSKTELHVLSYLRSQTTEKEIADRLGRSPHTVHVHVKNIYRKLGVSSRKHLSTLFNG